MSTPIDWLTGINLSEGAAMHFLGALQRACASKQPTSRHAIVVTPEHSYLTPRIELVDQYHGLGMHKLAARIARQSVRADEVLVVVVGDEQPAIRILPIAPLRTAFATAAARVARHEKGVS